MNTAFVPNHSINNKKLHSRTLFSYNIKNIIGNYMLFGSLWYGAKHFLHKHILNVSHRMFDLCSLFLLHNLQRLCCPGII